MSLHARILVVDDDRSQREELAGFLRDLGAEVTEAGDGQEALEMVTRQAPDLCLSDVRMPRMDGTRLLEEIHRINPEVCVVLVTAFGTVRDAVACLKQGAADYLLKPLDLDEVEHLVIRLLEERRLQRENIDLKARLSRIESVPGIVSAGGAMNEVLSLVSRVSTSDVSVLVHGESGTGKELVARAIHGAGPRSAGPFVAVNAGALPGQLLESELFGHEKGAFTGAERAREGRFEAASGGTIFLDEIGDLPADVQVKLLRVLQERTVERVGSNTSLPVDVRVIAATHRNLQERIDQGGFREDLFYRLAVVTIDIPPLKIRKSDIPLLVDHFLLKHGTGTAAHSISREAMDLLIAYDFPGNVRELENAVQHGLALARGSQLTAGDLPPAVLGSRHENGGFKQDGDDSLPGRVAGLEISAINEALVEAGGVQSRAARALGISERALRYKMSKYGMKG